MVLSLDLRSALILGILYLFFGGVPYVFRTHHGHTFRRPWCRHTALDERITHIRRTPTPPRRASCWRTRRGAWWIEGGGCRCGESVRSGAPPVEESSEKVTCLCTHDGGVGAVRRRGSARRGAERPYLGRGVATAVQRGPERDVWGDCSPRSDGKRGLTAEERVGCRFGLGGEERGSRRPERLRACTLGSGSAWARTRCVE